MSDFPFGLLEKSQGPLRYSAAVDNGLSDYALDVYLPILKIVHHGSRVLDVGCGSGDLANLLYKEKKVDIIGVERNNERACYASNERGIQVLNSDFESLNAGTLGKFDIIIFADILEHLENPGLALKKASSLLKPNGFIIVSLPNVAHWTIRIDLLFGRFNYTATGLLDATHLRFFTYKSMKRLFDLTGFQVLSTQFSLGSTLPIYSRFPWNLMPRNYLRRLLHLLVHLFPKLVGCQFLVKARPII